MFMSCRSTELKKGDKSCLKEGKSCRLIILSHPLVVESLVCQCSEVKYIPNISIVTEQLGQD